jgi:regulator of replication initiation timing
LTFDPREEPGALAAHAGICAGGEEQSSSLPRPTRLRIETNDALQIISVLQDVKLSENLNGAVAPLSQESASTSWSKWIASLETVQRLLETRLAMLGSPSSNERQAAPTAAAGSEPSGGTAASTRDEEALIQRATNGLLSTPFFKIMGLGLVAAALLAAGGSLVIGGTTASITKTLLDTSKAAKEDIGEIVKTAKSNVDTQVNVLEKYGRTAEAAQANFTREQERVRGELDGLKNKAVGDIIERMQLNLDREAKPLRDRIEQAANAFANEIVALRMEQLAGLKTRMGTLSDELSGAEQKRKDLAPQLASLDEFGRKIEKIQKDAARSGEYLTSTENAATQAATAKQQADDAKHQADAAAATAKQHADAAREHRDAVFTKITGLDSDIGKQLQIFGEIREKLNQLVRGVASLRPAVCDEPDLGSGPWVAQAQLNCLKQRIAAIEAQMKVRVTDKPPEPPSVRLPKRASTKGHSTGTGGVRSAARRVKR